MKKDKEWLKKKFDEVVEFRKESNPSSSWGMGSNTVLKHIKEDFENLIDQLDEPEVTLDGAFEKVAESYPMSKEEIWRHLERLETHGGKVTFGESEVFAKKKPIIPQFVADYIGKWEYKGLTMHEWFSFGNNNDEDEDVKRWLYNNLNAENRRREYLLVDAIRYGYTVEEEQKYYICLPNMSGENEIYIWYEGKTNNYYTTNDKSLRELAGNKIQFTEQEIKGYDERYLAFAKEVTE